MYVCRYKKEHIDMKETTKKTARSQKEGVKKYAFV